MKKILISILFLFIVAGCSSTRITDKTETVIKQDTIYVPVPVIKDTLTAVKDTINNKEIIHAEKTVNQDTVIQVKYYPDEKRIFIKVKPDTVIVPRIDTVKINYSTTITKEPNFIEKNIWYLILIAVVMIIIISIIKK